MSQTTTEKGVTIFGAIGILLVVLIALSGVGYIIGTSFYWDKHDTTSMYQRQLETLQKVAKSNPKNENVKVMLFDRYFGLGQHKEARKVLDELKKTLAKSPDIMYRDALMLRQEGNPAKAIVEIEKVIKVKPLYTAARILHAQLLANNKQYDQALEEIKMVLKIMPSAADLYLEEAKIYLAKGDKQNALASSEKALKMVPDYKEALELKQQIK